MNTPRCRLQAYRASKKILERLKRFPAPRFPFPRLVPRPVAATATLTADQGSQDALSNEYDLNNAAHLDE